MQGPQPDYFILCSSHNQFAANLVFDLMFLAECNHLPDPADRHARLQRPGFVIEPRMKYAAIMRALVAAKIYLFF